MNSLIMLPTESSLYKTRYSFFLRSSKYKIPIAQQKQEKWRQKQIRIYYSNGRPLYGQYKSNYNPSLYKF